MITEDKSHKKARYVLITNHHVLPAKGKLSESSLIVAGGTELRPIVPDTTTPSGSYFYSCCGPEGVVRETPAHVTLSEHEEDGRCPRGEDWTAVVLDRSFAQKLTRTPMTYPCLLAHEQSQRGEYSDVGVFERSPSGAMILHSVQPNFGGPERGQSLQHQVQDCISRFTIEYPYRESGDLGPGCSGGPIFVMDTLSLLGIHCSSPSGRDTSRDHCTGLSMNFIVSSLYCGT